MNFRSNSPPAFFSSRALLAGIGALCLVAAVLALPKAEPSPRGSTQDALLQKADRLEANGHFEAAIPLYNTLILQGGGREPRWEAYFFFRMACDQAQAGDRMGAMESVTGAIALDPEEPAYPAFLASLGGQEAAPRGPSARYLAERNQGSARRLTGTNGILHIFVRGRETDPWGAEEIEKMRQRLDESDRWLQARAAGAGAHPTFQHRFLTLPDEPFWRRIDVPNAGSSREYRQAWMKAVLLRFNADSYADLFDQTFEGADLDNRGIIFHVAFKENDLPGTAACRKALCDMDGIFVPTHHSEWNEFYAAVTYTHSLLHLYGADDLFNKPADPQVPENELMNFGAHRIDDCTLCGLTRYAIGWSETCPRLARIQVVSPSPTQKPSRKGTRT